MGTASGPKYILFRYMDPLGDASRKYDLTEGLRSGGHLLGLSRLPAWLRRSRSELSG